MLRNYLKITYRNLIKRKFYSILNILGLSVGLTSFLLIALFVKKELSYDRFHTDVDQIYRMDFEADFEGPEFKLACIGPPIAAAMEAGFPEVEAATRIVSSGNWLIRKEDQESSMKSEKVIYADQNFFSFFDFPLIYGDSLTCLERPKTLVLRRDLATKLFGDEDPTGQIVFLDNRKKWEVTGVFDVPDHTHLDYEMVFSLVTRKRINSNNWFIFHYNTYLKLKRGTDPKQLERKFPYLVDTHMREGIEKTSGTSLEEFYDAGRKASFSLFPLKDIHLKSHKRGELSKNGDMKYIYIFSVVALFILLLGCINFMNLATARSTLRSKEVGVRKVIGAMRAQLIHQFLIESFILTAISIVIAYGLIMLALPYFNELTDQEFPISALFTSQFIGIVLCVMMIVGLLAGSYPAFYLSGFRPIATLKGNLRQGLKGSGIRSVLVIIQFAMSITMIIATTVVFQQLSFIQNKKLGYSKDHVIIVHDLWILPNHDLFKEKALQHLNIFSGTLTRYLPSNTTGTSLSWFPENNPNEVYEFWQYYIDHDYLKTLEIDLAMGRDFSREFASDSSAILVNETALKYLGWEDPIGRTISAHVGINDSLFSEPYKIIGVVKDFHFSSLREKIEPLTLRMKNNFPNYMSFKVSSEDIAGTLDFLKAEWELLVPGQPFQYTFLDEEFDRYYRTDQKMSEIFMIFAWLAIFIACLGLYGLTAFTGEQRTREIGVRKVLGASIWSIIILLSKEFLKLVFIGFLVATPIAYYFMNNWLKGFENRIEISSYVFLLAGALALLVAWVTTSFQSWNAARINPAQSLSSE